MKKKKRDKVLSILKTSFPNRSRVWDEEKGEEIHFKGGLPGQKVRLLPKGKKGGKRQGNLLEILEPSPLETERACPPFGLCGGCSYQKLPYREELRLKKEQIEELYAPLYSKDIPIHPSPLVEGYRNKMEYSFGDEEKNGPLVLGLHRKNQFYTIVPTLECTLVHPDFETIRHGVEAFFRNANTPYYHKKTKEGVLRHLIVRRSMRPEEIMVNLVTTGKPWDREGFLAMLQSLPLEGRLTSVYHTKNDALSDAVIAEELTLLWGKKEIREEIAGLQFRISPFSFFQPNALGAEKLYRRAMELAGDLTDKKVFDLYSGTGTIAQIAAQKARHVFAIEIVEEAVEKAKESAKENGLKNIQFLAGDVFEKLAEYKDEVDVAMVDPPREGIQEKALERLMEFSPKEIIYISCNPLTQKKNAETLKEHGYTIKALEIFDQFPRTVHVECVALMSKK